MPEAENLAFVRNRPLDGLPQRYAVILWVADMPALNEQIIGVSATPQHFDNLLSDANNTVYRVRVRVRVRPEAVRPRVTPDTPYP